MANDALTMDSPSSQPSLALLFADIVGSSALYRRLGNEAAESSVGHALSSASSIVATHRGRTIKTIGDCVLAVLPNADAAVECATALQLAFQDHQDERGAEIRWRIGFACGPVVERDGDFFGDAVNLAARIADMAKSDQILTHDSSLDLLSLRHHPSIQRYDEVDIKGIGAMQGVLQVSWERRSQTEVFIIPAELRDAAYAITLQQGSREDSFNRDGLPLHFGRADACDWPIPSAFASREHLTLEYRRGKFTLVDHSTNGTFVMPADRGGEAVYVRNEAFPLHGEGYFCLGARPGADVPQVHYRIR